MPTVFSVPPRQTKHQGYTARTHMTQSTPTEHENCRENFKKTQIFENCVQHENT